MSHELLCPSFSSYIYVCINYYEIFRIYDEIFLKEYKDYYSQFTVEESRKPDRF